MIDAAEFFRARMHMHQLGLRFGDIEHAVALRRHFAETPADQQHQVGALHARQQFRIWPDAEIAGVAGMQRVEQMPASERGRDRQRKAFGKPHQRGVACFGPAAAADERDRALWRRPTNPAAGACRLRPARSPPARTQSRQAPRRARSACPPAARSPPDRVVHCRPYGRRAKRSPGCARDRRSRSPIWPWCRTPRGNRVPGTPRVRACRGRPGRRTRSSATNPGARCGCRPTHWWRPGRA